MILLIFSKIFKRLRYKRKFSGSLRAVRVRIGSESFTLPRSNQKHHRNRAYVLYDLIRILRFMAFNFDS